MDCLNKLWRMYKMEYHEAVKKPKETHYILCKKSFEIWYLWKMQNNVYTALPFFHKRCGEEEEGKDLCLLVHKTTLEGDTREQWHLVASGKGKGVVGESSLHYILFFF